MRAPAKSLLIAFLVCLPWQLPAQSADLTVRQEPARRSMQCATHELPEEQCRFHWRQALLQSGAFLAIEHGLNAGNYDRPPGGFFSNYADSVAGYRFGAWDDGDPAVYNYLGHPLMGAIAGRIQVQNDPRGADLRPGWTGPYAKSRLRALAWSAAYSAQWELGPLSESSLGNYGMRPYYRSRTGVWTNGTGMVDLVVTPLAGTALLVGEDLLDEHLLRRAAGRSRLWLLPVTLLNPARSVANLLRWKKPWYRDSGQVR